MFQGTGKQVQVVEDVNPKVAAGGVRLLKVAPAQTEANVGWQQNLVEAVPVEVIQDQSGLKVLLPS